MRICMRVHNTLHMCVCIHICAFFWNECCMHFGTGVLGTCACAGVYVIQMFLWYQRTHVRHTRCRGAHICICISMCICMHKYTDAYVRLWCFLTRWGVVGEILCLCMSVHVHAYEYVCACMHVYVHVHIYVYVYMCVCVYVCIYMYIHTKALGYLMWAQLYDGHLESPKNPDRLKCSIHVDHTSVQSTFVYMYAGLQVLMIQAHCLFYY